MKVIVAGSRGITSYDCVLHAILEAKRRGILVTELVSGTATGVDIIGETIAKEHDIPIVRFPAEWKRYGKAAGYYRNREMAKYADALIAVWDGKSKGTKNMIDLATAFGLKLYIHREGIYNGTTG